MSFVYVLLRLFAIHLCALTVFAQAAPQNGDTLTLDGSTLTVGPVGADKTTSLNVKELKLVNGSRIVTNGNKLKITASRITSYDGQIISFLPNNSRAPDSPLGVPGKAGADGGTVEIDAAELQGRLSIELPGQNGGSGGRGFDGVAGPAGARGNDGADHLFDCAHGGGDGRAGGDGSPGTSGAPGGAAGSGGTLTLRGGIKTQQNSILFSGAPGVPGVGGSGGGGGAPGLGGQGGSGSVYCRGGHPGPDGRAGANGSPGASGTAGQSGSIKLK